MPVLPLVCVRLGLLWLRPRPVAATVVAAFTPGLAVLSRLARAARLGWFADPAGVRPWLRITRLPNRAADTKEVAIPISAVTSGVPLLAAQPAYPLCQVPRVSIGV